MFKNATLYRWTGAMHTLPLFTPTLSTQQFSIGLEPPRGAHAALTEADMACARLERRSVPSATVQKHVDQLAAAVERETGRKPGKRERAELKDQALHELLPKAFPRQTRVQVWLRPDGLLVLDTSSASVADEVVTLLAACGLTITLVQHEAGKRMTEWLYHRALDHEALEFDGACALKAEGSTGKVVKYKNADVTVPEVGAHVAAGLRCTALALAWDEGEVGFTLTDGLVLKGLQFAVPFAGEWDADLVLFKAALGAVLDDLLGVLQ